MYIAPSYGGHCAGSSVQYISSLNSKRQIQTSLSYQGEIGKEETFESSVRKHLAYDIVTKKSYCLKIDRVIHSCRLQRRLHME